MLDYAVKLTKEPWTVAIGDVDGLRAVGFNDRAIHDICAVTAYYAFVNRIADGLGVELERDNHAGAR
jgi:alkylhydroperoxidase family enzyme